jgi:hypothetical protein
VGTPWEPQILAECPQLAARLQVFIESFNLVKTCWQPVLSNPGLGDALQDIEGILSWLRTTKYSLIVSTSNSRSFLDNDP